MKKMIMYCLQCRKPTKGKCSHCGTPTCNNCATIGLRGQEKRPRPYCDNCSKLLDIQPVKKETYKQSRLIFKTK